MHEPTVPVNITKNHITSGAYVDVVETHILLEFHVDVKPEFKLTKEPQKLFICPLGRLDIRLLTLLYTQLEVKQLYIENR